MTETQQSSFTGWAVVEMMGHRREIGYVTTEYFGPAAMFRVDTPELPEREFVLTHPEYAEMDGTQKWCPAGSKVKRAPSPARTCFVAPASLYAMNPCTEEAARTAIEKLTARPLLLIEAPLGALPAASAPSEELDEDDCPDCHRAPWECACP